MVLEPTDNTIQAGCVGNLNASLVFTGVSAHSARPWTGDNAIARAVHGLQALVDTPPRHVVIDGLEFTEVLSVTRITGGIADNVIPDRVECRVNFRFTPDRTMDEAQARMRELVGDSGALEISSVSPSGAVSVTAPLARRLRDAGDFRVLPKQAWTPVAQFTQEGIPAVNLGPGSTRYAHTRDERVSIAELERTHIALQRFLVAS
ncbi:MAG: peptidase dimerization domain-containing protein [Thermoleophilia bacterium]